MVDLKETVSSRVPRGKPKVKNGGSNGAAVKGKPAGGCESLDKKTLAPLKETGFCAKCGKKLEYPFSPEHFQLGCHVFVSCFAAPDVEKLLAEKDLIIEKNRDLLKAKDKEIEGLEKEGSEWRNAVVELTKEKDAEIERLQSELRMTAENTAFAFMKRDAKLADRVDALHDNVVEGVTGEIIEKEFNEVVGLLRGNDKERGEKTND